MSKVYAFCNQKGGVGKTTSAINLAASIAQKGFKTLLIDLDPQGNTTSGLGIDKTSLEKTIYDVLIDQEKIVSVIKDTEIPTLKLVPANVDLTGAEIELIDALGREFILKGAFKEIMNAPLDSAAHFDFVFIDCPPSLGILSLNALVSSDKLLIPLQCEYYALEGLGQLMNTFKLVKERLNPGLEIGGVILTMADFRTKLTGEVIQEVRTYFGDKVFETVIPRSVKLSEAPSYGKPAVLYDAANRGSQTYLKLAKEFIKKEVENKTQIAESAAENLIQSAGEKTYGSGQ